MESIVIGSKGALITLATGQDLTSATKMEMHAFKPDGTLSTWTASASSIAGSIAYITLAGDLNQIGIWKIFAYVEWGAESAIESPEPYKLFVVSSGSNITIAREIRAIINIPDTEVNELDTVVIQSAIDRATAFTNALGSKHGASAALLEAARLNYAAYLAYLSYSDRVRQTLPGAYENGKWTPIGEEIVRDTASKLRELKETYQETFELIKTQNLNIRVPTIGSISDSENYPTILEQSDIPASDWTGHRNGASTWNSQE